MRLLVIPARNEASRGFPFPLLPRVARLKEGFLTRPPNHVDNWSVADVANAFRDGRHRGLCQVRKFGICGIAANRRCSSAAPDQIAVGIFAHRHGD